VTDLRKIMLEGLQRRHYSEGTTHHYIRHVERFARKVSQSVSHRVEDSLHEDCPPPDDMRQTLRGYGMPAWQADGLRITVALERQSWSRLPCVRSLE
jgi:hypothetical protein